MFYLFTLLTIALVIGGYITAKCLVKDKEKFNKIVLKVLKITSIVYCVTTFACIWLPDAFALCIDAENLILNYKEVSFALVRWFTTLSFIMLPLAVFYKNRTIRNIAIYFCSACGASLSIHQPCCIKILQTKNYLKKNAVAK